MTSKNGRLVLPKVELINKTTLEPFIKNDADFASNKEKIKDQHAEKARIQIFRYYNLLSALAGDRIY